MFLLENVTKKFGKKIIRYPSIKILPNEVVGILGPNGCGKSTLAKMLVLMETPSTGVVTYRGENIHSFTTRRKKKYHKEIQIVFQNPFSSLNPRLTIKQILREPLSIHGMQRELEELLEWVNLSPSILRKYPPMLSGGELQRVAIARAIASEPVCLILDEPTSSLDPENKGHMIELLRYLQIKQHLTLLLISHDQGVIQALSTRKIAMF